MRIPPAGPARRGLVAPVVLLALSVLSACSAGPAHRVATDTGPGATPVPFGFWSLVDNIADQVEIVALSSCVTDLSVRAGVRGADDLVALTGAVRRHCTEGARPAERISVVLARNVGCGARIIDATTGHEAPRAPHAPPPAQFSCPAAPAHA